MRLVSRKLFFFLKEGDHRVECILAELLHLIDLGCTEVCRLVVHRDQERANGQWLSSA